MEWLYSLFIEHSALQAVVVLSLISAIGLGLGRVHFWGVEGRAAEMACDWMAPRRTKRGACRGRACPWVAYHSCLVSSPEEILAGD